MDGLENRIRLWLLVALGLLAAVILVQLLLPWLLLGAAVGAVVWGWQRWQLRQRQLTEQFYGLLRSQQGRISVLEFAMATQLDGRQARRFLDARARDFHGNFEVLDQGDLYYTFGLIPCESTDPTSLTLAQLAQRLGCTETLLQQRKWAADFAYWSQSQDPDRLPWRIDPISNRCYPLS